MKTLLISIAGALAILALTTSPAFAKPGWSDDYAKASAQAKAEKKLLLIDFTGSDWCGWCIKLDKEVFSKPEFQEYAKKNLVLVEADFTSDGKAKSKEFGKQQDAMLKEYKVQGFPTVVVLNADGKKIGETGYKPSPAEFIAELEKLKGK